VRFLKVSIIQTLFRSIGAAQLSGNPFGVRGSVIAIPFLAVRAANRAS